MKGLIGHICERHRTGVLDYLQGQLSSGVRGGFLQMSRSVSVGSGSGLYGLSAGLVRVSGSRYVLFFHVTAPFGNIALSTSGVYAELRYTGDFYNDCFLYVCSDSGGHPITPCRTEYRTEGRTRIFTVAVQDFNSNYGDRQTPSLLSFKYIIVTMQ